LIFFLEEHYLNVYIYLLNATKLIITYCEYSNTYQGGMNMVYSKELIKEAIELRASGVSSKSVCERYEISASILRKWEVEHSVSVPAGMTDSQLIWNLKSRIFELQTELEIWNQCTCSRKSKLSEKLVDLKRLAPRYGVHAVCRVLDVPRAAYYHHVFRSPEVTLLQQTDEKLRPVVKALFEETKGVLGSTKLRIIMMKRGYTIDLRHIRRLMREMDLKPVSRQRVAHNTEPPKQLYYQNRLKQRFDVERPNMVWVSDTSYIYVNREPFYLTVIIDLFSRRVIGYDVVDSIAAFPLISIFKKTFSERGNPEGLMFHSDQGSQYTAYRFRVLLRGYKVKQSFSAPGNPHDNAVAESFFKNFRAECTYVNEFKSVADMRNKISEYINFYNGLRPHNKLKGLTPNEFEEEYYKVISIF